jgi:hypothetical protein
MPPVKRPLIPYFVARLLIGILVSGLLLPSLVSAEEDKAPVSGRSAGGRGCGTEKPPVTTDIPALILLVPQEPRRQSTSSRPTFAWHVRDAEPRSIEFRLYEIEQQSFKLVKEITGEKMISSPGIMVMPPTLLDVPLTVGKRYRWQVELICNPSRPSSNVFAEAELEIVALPSDLKAELGQNDDRVKQAKIYQRANLWHDALGAAFVPTGTGSTTTDMQLNLLDQVAINEVERQRLRLSAGRSVLLKSSQIGSR